MARSNKNDNTRRRGIRASRPKLENALAASGFKTQTAVAERIADTEALEAAPRGLVNKVFRGELVDPRSIERVATALGVAAWSLYLSSDDPSVPTDDIRSGERPAEPPAVDTAGDRSAPGRPGRHRWVWLVSGVLLIGLAGVVTRQLTTPPRETGDAAENTVRPLPRSMQPTALIIRQDGPRGEVLTEHLSRAVDRGWRVLPNAAAEDTSHDPQDLLVDNSIDRVVRGRITSHGRWLGVTIERHEAGSMRVAWVGSLRAHASEARIAAIMQKAAAAVVGNRVARVGALEAQAKYVAARENLDKARTELNLRRALTDFQSAIRSDDQYVDAYAGLCEALVVDNVRTGDSARLMEAEPVCQQALELDPENVEALRAMAYLDRRRGRLGEALEGFESVLATSPDNTDGWLGIAEVHLAQFRSNADPDGIPKAADAISRAATIDPGFWKIPFTLARIHYFSNDLGAAIAEAERTVELDANVFALSNLGSFQFCRGDFQAARAAYTQARVADPREFVGDGQLAVVHYFLEDFDAATTGFKAALDLHEETGKADDHRLWGNYADALRHAGESAAAATAYAKAIRLAERDRAGGEADLVRDAYLAAYYEMLPTVDESASGANRVSRAELDALSQVNDPFSLMYLAIIYERRGLRERSEELRMRGSEGCPGFAASPDFASSPQ